MASGYRIGDQHALHFLTFTIVDWIDVFTPSLRVACGYAQHRKLSVASGYFSTST